MKVSMIELVGTWYEKRALSKKNVWVWMFNIMKVFCKRIWYSSWSSLILLNSPFHNLITRHFTTGWKYRKIPSTESTTQGRSVLFDGHPVVLFVPSGKRWKWPAISALQPTPKWTGQASSGTFLRLQIYPSNDHVGFILPYHRFASLVVGKIKRFSFNMEPEVSKHIPKLGSIFGDFFVKSQNLNHHCIA